MERPDEGRGWLSTAVGRFEGPLTLYAMRIVRNRERAQDVVQETFLRLWREKRDRVEGRLAEWLYTVCRNLAIDVQRKEKRVSVTDVAGDGAIRGLTAAGTAGPAEAAERGEATANVLKAMETLSEHQQEVIRLKFQHGLSYRQISEVTRLSEGNVGFLIHTGLKAIRQHVGEG